MKLIAGVNDSGTNYRIMSVFQGDEAHIFEFGGVRMYEISTIECYNAIQTALTENKEIYFPKNLINPLTENELIIQAATDLVASTRAGIKTQAKQFTSNRLGSLSMFDFYGFTIINNILIDKGYAITEENREAKYLEIVNTGDASLIDVLDIYLTLKDKLDANKSIYANFKNLVDDLDTLTTIPEMEARLNIYYASYS